MSSIVCQIEVHANDCGTFVVSDQAGWLPGVYGTPGEALAAAARANDLTVPTMPLVGA